MSGNAKIFLKAGLTQGRDVNSRGKGLMHCDPPPHSHLQQETLMEIRDIKLLGLSASLLVG